MLYIEEFLAIGLNLLFLGVDELLFGYIWFRLELKTFQEVSPVE